MIVELIAIETSGLEASKDVILEAAIGRWTEKSFSGEAMCIDPGSHDLSPEIIEYHTKTGLIQDLMKERATLSKASKLLGVANLRIVWARDFALPFLKGTPLDAACNSVDSKALLALGRLKGCVPAYDVCRAGDKVIMMKQALEGLMK